MDNTLEPTDFETFQENMVSNIEQFSKDHPEIIEAMKVMNMSMADYIEAMDSVRGGQTFSSSSFCPIPTQLPG